MSAKLELKGIDELRKALRELPKHLTSEASEIVNSTANELRTETQNALPRGPTGKLISTVRVEPQTSSLVANVVIRLPAKHAHLVEYGTETRQTALGWKRGKMPPRHIFVPRAIRARKRMWDRIERMLTREGLAVSGDAP
jgi:hypothetical protein